jgi:capsular exopolysaccharide synthesis family protein
MIEPSNAPRESSVASYGRTLKRHKRLVGVIVVVFIAASLVISFSKPTRYTAQATVLFQDPNEALTLTGAAGSAFLTAQQLAQIGADTIISPSLLTVVKRQLGTSLSTKQLNALLSTSANPATNQVTIQAEGSTGPFAARLANAAANLGAISEAKTQRATYASEASRLQAQEATLGKTAADANQRVLYADQINRLRTLSTLTDPVQVASSATVPTSPSSPKPITEGILFGILGLVVAAIAAVVRESFDRRLRSTEDIEEELELPVLGHVGEDALGKAGDSGYGLGALDESDVEAFRIVRTNLRFNSRERPPTVILVTSPMPQEGKSTVAASLAYSYAMAGQTTLLVECDFRRPSLAERLGVSNRPGLTDYLVGACDPGDIVQIVPYAAADLSTNGNAGSTLTRAPLAAIVAGEHLAGRSAELFEASAFVTFLAEVSKVYDAVVVDTAPLLPVADTLEIVPHADTILVCVRASQTTRSQAAAGKAALEPVADRIAGIVVTGVSVQDRAYYGYYGYYGYGDTSERSTVSG